MKISEEKMKIERDSNINLYSTIRMNLKALKEAILGTTDEERKRFFIWGNCIGLLSLVDPKGESTYCMDVLPDEFPLLWPRWCVIHENG